MEGLTLSPKEQKRLMVIGQIDRKEVTVGQAAVLMGLSQRHLWRLLAAWRRDGPKALAHGNRGRSPPNKLARAVRDKVIELVREKYAGANICHLTDLLLERDSLRLSRSSVRRVMMAAGLKLPRTRRAPRHRKRRERFPSEGQLLQIDGSYHDWLDGRGPWLTLIGAIDDATGKVPYALFRENEDSHGYFGLLREIVRRYGIPLAVYHDQHSIFQVNQPEPGDDEWAGVIEPERRLAVTQFGRLLEEVGIESIISRSPQSRGRIERLWGTFQDRLAVELRLAGACDLESANRVLADFVPSYNRKFAVPAAEPETAWRPLPPGFSHDEHFCFKYERVAGTDNVVSYNGRRIQVFPCHGRSSYARLKVEVHEHLDGSITLHYRGDKLVMKEAPLEAALLRARATTGNPKLLGRPVLAPKTDHPWRQWVHNNSKTKAVLTKSLNI